MRNKYRLKIRRYHDEETGKEMIEYTCVECGHRQAHIWFGREKHYCNECGKETEIKGFEE